MVIDMDIDKDIGYRQGNGYHKDINMDINMVIDMDIHEDIGYGYWIWISQGYQHGYQHGY